MSVTDVDSQVTITVPAVPVGGSLSSGVVVRRIGSTDYSARLTVNTSGTVNIELLRGSTSLQTVRVQGLTAAAGSVIHLRVRAIGTAPTTLQARAWADGATEPTTWQATTTDATAALQAAGGIGVRTYAGTGLTNGPLAVRFDDLLVAAP